MIFSKTGVTLFLLLSCFISFDGFQKVIDQTKNNDLKNRLKEFREGGIEKTVEISPDTKEAVIAYARSFLGTPHRMGGTNKKGIDCSGLVMAAFQKYGVSLPHSSEEQARFGKIIADPDHLKRGDLVFFYNSYKTPKLITHSGIYLDNMKFIHASTSQGVVISKVDDPYYWGKRYLFATRVF